MRLRLTVVVPTYRRPQTLASNLTAVLAQVEEVAADPALALEADVLVVDNDASGSARSTVEGFGSERVRYVVEPEPGITAARNRGLDECTGSDLLAFVDDDETPEPEWLAHLVRTWAVTEPAAVMGRVVSAYESDPDPWVLAGRFFVRVRRETGTEIDVAACGNLLLDLRQVRELGVRFDPRFGLTGGEDTMFSRQLRARGGRIVWCDESVAVDVVPDDRANRRWVLDRARRSGNSSSLIDIALAAPGAPRLAARVRAGGGGALRLAAGHARHLLGSATGSAVHQARGLRTASRGRGMLDAVGGRVIEEYAR
ncbi:MAG: glycosyltransferase family 2 protein [Quadrisphaera sp.]